MVCLKCSGTTTVIDSTSDDESVYRRRKCLDCGNVFYTIEVVQNASRSIFDTLKKRYWAKYRDYKKKG